MDTALALATENKLEAASVCLCHTSLRFAAQAELWVLRAMLARRSGHLDRADMFLRRALTLEELPNAYLELIHLRLAQNRAEDARSVREFLEYYLGITGELDEFWLKTLRAFD